MIGNLADSENRSLELPDRIISKTKLKSEYC
jgi:hypothetical protein